MTTEQCYILDALYLMIERAKEAKLAVIAAKNENPENVEFKMGEALAYYEVVSTLIHQAEVFGLSRDMFPMLTFDPDKELL